MSVRITAYDASARRWLEFRRPLGILEAGALADVAPALAALERETARGRWAAGFLAYEAAPAFDRALTVRDPDPHGLPLLWFGLFDEPATVPRPEPAAVPPAPDWSAAESPETYAGRIRRVLDQIRLGNTYQVNYTIRYRAPFAGSPRDLFAALVDAQEPPYGMAVETEAWALCGASPELFLDWENRALLTKPMKGTRPRGLWPAEDHRLAAELAAAEKDRAEHVMIVDMARNDFGRIARTGTVRVDRPFAVEAYPTVWQMTSEVRCETEAGLGGILAATFPAASITGAPKASTMALIAGLEGSPRGIYTGAMGIVAPGRRARFAVAIRTVAVDRRRGLAEYGTGGGIVWDSTPEAEWEECRVKARILGRRPPPFALLETVRWSPDGGLYLLEEHLDRLAESAGRFGYRFDRAGAEARLRGAVAALAPEPHRVRLLVSRDGTAEVQAAPLRPLPAPYRVRLAAGPVDRADPFLYHKTTRRAVYEEAMAAAGGADDALLWNDRGEVTETTIANVLVEIGGRWTTPPVACGLLGGVCRQDLLRRGLAVERVIRREELAGRRIRLCNSVRGCWDAELA